MNLQKHLILVFLIQLVSFQIFSQTNYASFDGIDDYIQVPADTFFSDVFSIEAKFVTRKYQPWCRILDFGNGPGQSNVWIGYDWVTDRIAFEVWNNGFPNKIVSDKGVPLNQLNHLVITFNGIDVIMFLNGEQFGSGFLVGPEKETRSLNYIGKSNWSDPHHNFLLESLRIWDIPLSLNQIDELKDSVLTGNETNLILGYDFSALLVDTVYDQSSNDLHGIRYGGAQWIENCVTDTVNLVFELTDLPLDTLCFLETWERATKFKIVNDCLSGINIPSYFFDKMVANETVAQYIQNQNLKGLIEGLTEVYVSFEDASDTFYAKVEAPFLDPEFMSIDPLLATPAEGAIYEIPVIIMRFLPTSDGINIDVSKAPGYETLNPITIAAMKDSLLLHEKRAKFMLEEGSRYEGFKNQNSFSSVGYKVIEVINVFEQIPPGKPFPFIFSGIGGFQTDYHQIFERFNLQDYVNNQDVKEFWIWSAPLDENIPSYDPLIHHPDHFRIDISANMSSSLTGNINFGLSNESALPIYDHTFLVMNKNLRSNHNNFVRFHNLQIEEMLSYSNFQQDGNTELFITKFEGRDEFGIPGTGRCGSPLYPPNTTFSEDYNNPTLVLSDIEDWSPDSLGQFIPVNFTNWQNQNYSWPIGIEVPESELSETQWYIYWMQAFPGFNNGISYQDTNVMTNWWDIYADWDNSILSGKGLCQNKCNNGITIPDPATTNVYQKEIPISYSGTILQSNYAIFKSQMHIDLEPGFEVPPDTQFEAVIDGCGGGGD